jgi:hypothetical protein
MEANMNRTSELDTQRLPDGSIDFDYYRRRARRSRQLKIRRTARGARRAAGRLAAVLGALVVFWNIPPMGGSRDKPPYL